VRDDLELTLGTRRTVRDDHGILVVLGHLGDPAARLSGDAPTFFAPEQGQEPNRPDRGEKDAFGVTIGSAFANIRS
jgi:hypothetical protein